MNQSSLEILVQLKDEASVAFKKMASGITGTSQSMTGKLVGDVNESATSFAKWGLAAVTAAGGIAVAFGVSAVKSFSQAQAAMTRVDSILQTMGKSALQNRDAILKAADSAIKLGFDDEAAAESITKLYQRTKDLSEAIKLNSFAMDLARFKNISLSEASRAVNMALSGNVRMLKELGVVSDETLSPLEAIGQAQKVVANQAINFASTWPGMMLMLQETWSNFKDGIGAALVDALMPFVKQFSAWLSDPKTKESLAQWTAEFKSWAEVIIPTIIDAFKILAGWIQTILDLLIQVGNSFSKLATNAKKFGSDVVGGAKIVGGGLTSIGHALGFAEGGIVTKPTLAMIGEAGESEAVIPLSKLGNIGGGGGGITINMTGTFYTESQVAERMGNQIAKIVGQQLKIRTI